MIEEGDLGEVEGGRERGLAERAKGQFFFSSLPLLSCWALFGFLELFNGLVSK